MPITKSIGNTPFFISLINLLLFAKYFDTYIIKPILANSLGCIPKPPIPNQLLLPFLILPKPGIKTSIKSIKHINNIVFAFS